MGGPDAGIQAAADGREGAVLLRDTGLASEQKNHIENCRGGETSIDGSQVFEYHE